MKKCAEKIVSPHAEKGNRHPFGHDETCLITPVSSCPKVNSKPSYTEELNANPKLLKTRRDHGGYTSEHRN